MSAKFLKPLEAVLKRSFAVPKPISGPYIPNATLTNGTKGQKIFPRHTILRNVAKQLPTAIQAMFASTMAMAGWCVVIMVASDFSRGVPMGFHRTAAVKIVKYGDNPEVEFV
ncbi:uncharacterized protein RJT20DRAFT_1904 [Scheffersomyces xylosifermentans]|uniref:uncharacterized protein n=1 Tax=Scheffersomyces xylosifermentans TaxID=1304137 RepID=UPI00315DADE3